MKKNKLVALILSSVMASMCMVTPISAEEYLVNRPPISQSSNGIATYDWMYPTRTWDLSKNPYEYSGNATKSEIYTNYRFYGVDSLAIQITTNTADSVTVKVRQTLIDDSGKEHYSVIKTKKISGNTTTSFAVPVTNAKGYSYYLSFSAPCDVSGTIY